MVDTKFMSSITFFSECDASPSKYIVLGYKNLEKEIAIVGGEI